MAPRIVVAGPADTLSMVDDIAPSGYEIVKVAPGSAECTEALKSADYLVGFVDMLVKDALYKGAPRLKLIQLLSAGYDRADLKAARAAKVPISNNGGANSVAVSEHAMLLMLAVSRKLIQQHANVTGGRWRGNSVPKVHEVRGKTLGIIGLGTIGKKTARLAQAFGMIVTYYDIARLTEAEEDALNVRFRLLPEIITRSDIISLHVPLNDTTHHLLGAAEIARMKPSAIIVNTSRGPVIDEKAMHAALAAGKIAGAGLDVFDEEPPPADNPLFTLDNVQRVARGEAPLWVIPELGL